MGILSITESAKTIAEQKKLDSLVKFLGGSKLPLRKPCMEGTQQTILQEIESKVKRLLTATMLFGTGDLLVLGNQPWQLAFRLEWRTRVGT